MFIITAVFIITAPPLSLLLAFRLTPDRVRRIDILNPTPDVVNVEVPMLEGSLSPCVFCICRKKDVKKMREDHKDLGDFTGKPTSCTGMPDSLTCLTDTREALDTLLSRNDDKFKGS